MITLAQYITQHQREIFDAANGTIVTLQPGFSPEESAQTTQEFIDFFFDLALGRAQFADPATQLKLELARTILIDYTDGRAQAEGLPRIVRELVLVDTEISDADRETILRLTESTRQFLLTTIDLIQTKVRTAALLKQNQAD